MSAPTIGVLALQGAFAVHAEIFAALGCATQEVRTAEQLAAVDGLVVPGGESTTMSMLLERSAMLEPLRARIDDGLPVFGTCAGMILLSADIRDGRDDQHALGVLDLSVTRNGYGRQIDSFEADIDVAGLDEPFHAVFIRAPKVERVGDSVEVLATVDGDPVLCARGNVLAAAFHPELSDDDRIHRRWLASAALQV
ncbi:MAG: pyridoxal 5'-phosphate synthase glutaminase subunit PdxT [Acidimicrobiales bacterium]|nr:pyridoxal 5'-phosphate synthase glutaminase subunit PdxT [Acidimicrobiales bacterium]